MDQFMTEEWEMGTSDDVTKWSRTDERVSDIQVGWTMGHKT